MPIEATELQRHNQAYHNFEDEDLPNDYLSPYRFLRDNGNYICVLGCEFKCQNQNDIRQHLIDAHTDEECEMWGYSRDLLY